MKRKLVRCKECGHKPIIERIGKDGYRISCRNCNTETAVFMRVKLLVHVWNTENTWSSKLFCPFCLKSTSYSQNDILPSLGTVNEMWCSKCGKTFGQEMKIVFRTEETI